MTSSLSLHCFDLKILASRFNCTTADLLPALSNRLADLQSLTPPNTSAIVHWDVHSRDRLLVWEQSAAAPSNFPPSPSIPPNVASFCSAAAHLHSHGVIVAFLNQSSLRITSSGSHLLRYWFLHALLQPIDTSSTPLRTLCTIFPVSASNNACDLSSCWASPEIIKGDTATPACDVWLAGMLFAAAIGVDLDVLPPSSFAAAVADAAALHPACPVFSRCLQVDPSKRPTMQLLAATLAGGFPYIIKDPNWTHLPATALHKLQQQQQQQQQQKQHKLDSCLRTHPPSIGCDNLISFRADFGSKTDDVEGGGVQGFLVSLAALLHVWLLHGGSVDTVLSSSSDVREYPVNTAPMIMCKNGASIHHPSLSSSAATTTSLPSAFNGQPDSAAAWTTSSVSLSSLLQGRMGANSIAQLQDLSEKFRLVQLLSLPSHSPNAASGIDVSDYDFGPWLLDLLPPMRPLVWSLVLKIFARFSEKDACEREFDAALRSAHLLPVDTLKQIEADLSRCHAVDALIGSTSGRIKLSQLLLALLVTEPEYSYIQGMDSLAAVCLKLFYASPPRALLLLRSIIDRFLGKVVSSRECGGGTDWLLLRLRSVDACITCTRPDIALRLADAGASAETHCVSWILTLFAHELPLLQVLQLWDFFLGQPPAIIITLAASIICLRVDGIKGCVRDQISLLSAPPAVDLLLCKNQAASLVTSVPECIFNMAGFNPRDTHTSTTRFSMIEGLCITCIDVDTVRGMVCAARPPVVLVCRTLKEAADIKRVYDMVAEVVPLSPDTDGAEAVDARWAPPQSDAAVVVFASDEVAALFVRRGLPYVFCCPAPSPPPTLD